MPSPRKPYCHIDAEFQEEENGESTIKMHVQCTDTPSLLCAMGHLVNYVTDRTGWTTWQAIAMLQATANAARKTEISSEQVRMEVPRK